MKGGGNTQVKQGTLSSTMCTNLKMLNDPKMKPIVSPTPAPIIAPILSRGGSEGQKVYAFMC